MMVNVGTKSNPGKSSSINDTTPATLPAFPLKSLVIIQPEIGAQPMSRISPKPGKR